MNSNIPKVVKNLLIINSIIYLLQVVLEYRGIDLTRLGGLHFFMADDFHLHQLITYQFLHGSMSHIFWNMFALWMFGVVMEQVWGPRKFLFYYLSCGVGAGLMQELVQFFNFYFILSDSNPGFSITDIFTAGQQLSSSLNGWTTIGASGAVYAILLAFGMTFPEQRIMLLIPPIPIKAKWLVAGYAVIEMMLAMQGPGDGVAHMAHLGGMLFGFFMIRYWNKHPNASSTFGQGGSSVGGFFDELKSKFTKGKGQFTTHRGSGADKQQNKRGETDAEYNRRKQQRQEEVDRILDKIRKSGYDSLTREEKQRLFERDK